MRRTLKRLLRIIVITVFLAYYIFLFSAAVYLSFSGSKENRAHSEFRDAYDELLSEQKLPWDNPEFSQLEKEYADDLRLRLNEAFANRNNADALKAIDPIKRNLEKKKAVLQDSRLQLLLSVPTIDSLFEIAQSLSTREKRSIGLKIASLVEEVNNLGQEWIMLMVNDEAGDERINELYRDFAQARIDAASLNEQLREYRTDSDRMRRSAYRKVLQAERKKSQISREWSRLDSLF